MEVIGRPEHVPLRELWKHEERNFSRWLADHIDVLSDEIGMSLLEIERERQEGAFPTDILAMDELGNRVIIENQLERTDHDHLGKVIVHLTQWGAKSAIWVASEVRGEHRQAVEWLNEVSPDDVSFFLVRLTAYRIGNSVPAPQFTVIVGPSREAKSIGHEKKELAERDVMHLRFWEQLLANAKAVGVMTHAGVSPSKDYWLSTGAGKTGMTFTYSIFTDQAAVELYIDTRDGDRNKRIFDFLYSRNDEIGQSFGGQLDWQRLDDKRASRIRSLTGTGGLRDEDNWAAIQTEMIAAMHLFRVCSSSISLGFQVSP